MKKINLIIIALVFTQLSFAQNWIAQNSGTDSHLEGVYFNDINNGIAVGSEGAIIRTTDGGDTWNVIPSGTTLDLYNVTYATASKIFVVGEEGTILISEDAGLTWNPQNSETPKKIRNVIFADDNTGFAVGSDQLGLFDPELNGEVFLKTTNGGANWTKYDQFPPFAPTEQLLVYAIDILDINTIIIAGTREFQVEIFKSSDGGANFIREESVPAYPSMTSSSAIQFASPDLLYIAGAGLSKAYKSTDGGVNWFNILDTDVLPNMYQYAEFLDMYFTNENNGFMCGEGDDEGIIVHTTDGGNNWSLETLPTPPGPIPNSAGFKSMDFPASNVGYVVGTGGAIYKWTSDNFLISEEANICVGSSSGTMTLTGGIGTVTLWEKRIDQGNWTTIANTSNTYSEVISESGVWEYRVVIDNGNSYSNSIQITAYENPVANFSYTTDLFEVTFENYSTNSISYSWNFGDGTGTSANENPVYEYAENGNYSVVLIASNGLCEDSEYTESVVIDVTSIKELNKFGINIYPNPHNGLFYVETQFEIVETKITDLTGRTVYYSKLQNNALQGSKTSKIDITMQSKGIYIINIKSNKQSYNATIILN